MKNATYSFLAVAFSAALLTACSSNNDPSAHSHTSGMDHSQHGGAQSGNTLQVKADWKITHQQQADVITFQIQDNSGKPIEEFDISHEKKMHLIVVNKDLSYFDHIHPEYEGNGLFKVTTQFPSVGDYKLIADFVPKGSATKTESTWIKVGGDAPQPQPLLPDTNLTKIVDGKEVTLSFDKIQAGKELNFTFNIKDTSTKKPISDLQPYLGAVGHVVVLSADTEKYLHVHPTEEKATGPDAKFMTTFPNSGTYKIWGQFQHQGQVFIVPFVVQVP